MCGVPRVSEDHLTARREQILAAARTCFLTKGLHNTSMQDLIQEAGLSVGAVYRYFRSKHEIISAVAETVAGSIERLIEDVAARRLPLIDSLDLILAETEPQIVRGGQLGIALQIWGEATLDPAIGEIVRVRYGAMRASVRHLVENAVAGGELPVTTDVDAVTTVVFSLIPGFAMQRMLTGIPDRKSYVAGLRALLAAGGH
jgi:AcrR family transcriptional regulator